MSENGICVILAITQIYYNGLAPSYDDRTTIADVKISRRARWSFTSSGSTCNTSYNGIYFIKTTKLYLITSLDL